MAKQIGTAKVQNVVAEICLYGTHHTGAGWLAQSADGLLFGTGEPVGSRSFTEAVYMAMGALEGAGITSGTVRVFDAGGERMALVKAGGAVPNYGGLTWQPAIVYTISSRDILAAAEPALAR